VPRRQIAFHAPSAPQRQFGIEFAAELQPRSLEPGGDGSEYFVALARSELLGTRVDLEIGEQSLFPEDRFESG
jgi:hypothetical protein